MSISEINERYGNSENGIYDADILSAGVVASSLSIFFLFKNNQQESS